MSVCWGFIVSERDRFNNKLGSRSKPLNGGLCQSLVVGPIFKTIPGIHILEICIHNKACHIQWYGSQEKGEGLHLYQRLRVFFMVGHQLGEPVDDDDDIGLLWLEIYLTVICLIVWVDCYPCVMGLQNEKACTFFFPYPSYGHRPLRRELTAHAVVWVY